MGETTPRTVPSTTVIDLGRHRARRVRQLHRGTGTLMEIIQDTLTEVRDEESEGRRGADQGQHVFIVERRRSRRERRRSRRRRR
jgi:hypothetical protein